MDALLVVLAVLLALVLGGFVYQTAGLRRDARRYPPPGRLVDAGGFRLHMHEAGTGSPAVVLESGIAASSLNWRHVWTEVARFRRVVSYDRAGLGWSEPAPTPRTLRHIVEELHAMLQNGGVAPPYVLVGHSFGGLVVRGYAAEYPDEVVGIVLVDPLPETEWRAPSALRKRMLARGIRLSRRGALLARISVVRGCLDLVMSGVGWLPRLVAKASSGRGAGVTDRMAGEVRKMPREVWPMVKAHWCDPKCFEAMAAHLEALPESSEQAANLPTRPPIPAIVLSGENALDAQTAAHAAYARASSAVHWVVSASGHWIQLDRPEVVVEAIRQLVTGRSKVDAV